MFKKIVLMTTLITPSVMVFADVTTSCGFTLITTAQITESKQIVAREMKIRSYIKPVTLAAVAGVLAYQLGWIDSGWERVKGITKASVVPPASAAAAVPAEYVTKDEFAAFKEQYKINIKKGFLSQGWEMAKTMVLWATIKLAADLVIPASLNMWFARPDFVWMYKQRAAVIAILESAAYNANEYAKSLEKNPERALYHKDNLIVNVKKFIPNMVLVLSYMEYRFEQLPDEMLMQHGLKPMPAHLIKTANDFLVECSDALDLDNAAKVVELLKTLRGEIMNSYTRCIALE